MISESIYVGLLGGTALVSLGIAGFSIRHRQQTGAVPLAVLMLAIAGWALAYSLQLPATNPGWVITLSKLKYVGIVVVPIGWFLFALEYTGRSHYLTPRRSLVFLLIPVATGVVIWTNQFHGLMWRELSVTTTASTVELTSEDGPWFIVHTVYSYFLLASGTLLLIHLLVLADHIYRGQALLLLGGALVPWVSNGLYVTDLVSSSIDPTPFALMITGVLFAGAIFRHKLLTLVPIARDIVRDEVITGLTDGILVVDTQTRIVDGNPAVQNILGCDTAALVGQSIHDVLPAFAEAGIALTDAPIETECTIQTNGTDRYYDVQVTALNRGYGVVSGYLITLHDVTTRKRRTQRLDVLNRLLRHNLRNDLTVIGGQIDLVRAELADAQLEERLSTAAETTDNIVSRINKLSRVSTEFDDPEIRCLDVTELLTAVVEDQRESHPRARITIECTSSVWARVNTSIEFVFTELIANAIEHTTQSNPRVTISVETTQMHDQDVCLINFIDNGPGIPTHEIRTLAAEGETPLQHSNGVGLWIAAWIVRSSGGDLEFTTSESGSTVTVRLPRTTPPEERHTH